MVAGIQSTRRTVLVALSVLALHTAPPAFAQASFDTLALRLNLDDPVRIEDTSDGTASGRLTGLTPDALVLQTDRGERRFTRGTVREVRVRGYGLSRAATIGAAAFAVLGGVAMCAHDEERCAVIGPLGAAPIGAGLGLVIGALVPRTRPVYRASRDGTVAPLAPAEEQAGFFADLALRVNLDDQLQVEPQSGGTTTGRLTRLTADAFTLHTAAGDATFTRQTVRRVSVRRHPTRVAVLSGAGAGALIGAVAACTGSEREECADAPLMAGALGAGAGLIVGVLTHRTAGVYPEADRLLRVSPLISRSAIGVSLARRW